MPYSVMKPLINKLMNISNYVERIYRGKSSTIASSSDLRIYAACKNLVAEPPIFRKFRAFSLKFVQYSLFNPGVQPGFH